ncbi:MAG: DegT/DnrJ/EryC1/StrS aminotransferase family protein [Pseudomonadota bacterium]
MSVTEVPFFRPSIGDGEIDAVVECLKSGWLTTAGNAAAFEAEFAEAMGGGVHAVAVNSATAAMHLALDALGIGEGDEVIVPTLTFTATAEVVRYMGATPLLTDMDPATFCMTPELAEAVITEKTRAIMPVHFAGRSCDMTGLRALADTHNLAIVDDAAHALPTEHAGALIGSTGARSDITAFSFYANKTMTTGEGGMLVTADEALAKRARIMRLHGIDRDVFDRFTNTKAGWIYDVVAPGFKYNLTDIAAAMGRVQLSRVDGFRADRAAQAARYDEALADLPLILPPHAAPGDSHSWHLYIVQLADDAPIGRNDFILALKEAGVGCSVHYRPLHQMTYWADAAPEGGCPAAEDYFKRCVSLPLFMDMTEDEQTYVIATIRGLLGG